MFSPSLDARVTALENETKQLQQHILQLGDAIAKGDARLYRLIDRLVCELGYSVERCPCRVICEEHIVVKKKSKKEIREEHHKWTRR